MPSSRVRSRRFPRAGRAQAGAQIVARLIDLLSQVSEAIDRDVDLPLDPHECCRRFCDASPTVLPEALDAPLTPLLDTTLLTNSRGEPAMGHEIRAEIHSSDSIDVVMAFVRWSGIRPLLEALRRHCRDGKTSCASSRRRTRTALSYAHSMSWRRLEPTSRSPTTPRRRACMRRPGSFIGGAATRRRTSDRPT